MASVAHQKLLANWTETDMSDVLLQAALAYLAAEVPSSSQSTIMYNTILSSAQHHGKAAVSAKALEMMVENGVPRDAQTWVHVFRSLVTNPYTLVCLLLSHPQTAEK